MSQSNGLGLSEMSLLWVCDGCEMIGSERQAKRHTTLKGHRTRELDREATNWIREQWRSEGRSLVDGAEPPSRGQSER